MKRTVVLLLVLGAIAAALGYAFRSRWMGLMPGNRDAAVTASGDPRPASELTPDTTNRGVVSIDPRRQQLIGVRTVAVRRGPLERTIRTTGIVRADETRLADVNLKLDGWIRELHVDYTGQAVRKGQPLFTLYSPELFATEQEYILALASRDQMQSSPIADVRTRADQLVAAARQRLALWDLPAEEIDALAERREPHDAVLFRSPVDGVVMDKQAVKGAHVTAGQTLYRIADLSVVWIDADVYETEMPLVRVGGAAVVTLDAYPGERFTGRAVYIYPYVDEGTRTNKVRYEFVNRGGRLKPGMYANVEIGAAASGGSTGLIIPSDAVLDSGREQIVFVALGDGYFEPRRVEAGARSGTDIQVLEGLEEGEMVATGATFFLDSESQLRASLRNFETTGPPPAPPREQFNVTLRSLPDPPRMGDNTLEVTVKDPAGAPVDGADVAVEFFMPAMPTMNMPAMRSAATLSPAGGGVYRGTGQVMMAGRWDATVTVTKDGQRLASTQIAVVAK